MTSELPYETRAAVALDDQAQFDPMHVLTALVSELRSLGGHLVTGVRVTGVRTARDLVEVMTPRGSVHAQHVVLATGYDKWGMTNAVAAALTIVGDRLGAPHD